jgi:hypothetical protein
MATSLRDIYNGPTERGFVTPTNPASLENIKKLFSGNVEGLLTAAAEAEPTRVDPRPGLLSAETIEPPQPESSAVQQFMDYARTQGSPMYDYDAQGNLVQVGNMPTMYNEQVPQMNAADIMDQKVTPSGTAVDAIRIGANAAKIQKENQQTESLLGGIFDNPIVKQIVAGLAAPEFLASQYGLGGRSPVAALVGGMQANQAREVARTKEAAKLQEEMRQQAVKEAQKAEELEISRIRAERETVRPATVTGPKVEAYMRYLKGNKTLAKQVNKIAKEGNYLFTTEKEREDVRNALALEAINIQNANPRLTMQQAFNQALGIMRGGTLSTASSGDRYSGVQ